MAYRYLVVYQGADNTGQFVGNMDVLMSKKITTKEQVRDVEAELRVKNDALHLVLTNLIVLDDSVPEEEYELEALYHN